MDQRIFYEPSNITSKVGSKKSSPTSVLALRPSFDVNPENFVFLEQRVQGEKPNDVERDME